MAGTDLTRRQVAEYLSRLGIDDPGAPSEQALRRLHRAHVERIPYEVIDVQLGRPTSADPAAAVAAVLRGRGGYCVQLNTAFTRLLAALGYDVTWHEAQVSTGSAPANPTTPSAPHLAATVLLDGVRWFVDVGLGDGLHDPLPLRAGTYRQGPFTFQLSPSELRPGGWQFRHDPRGAITALDFPLTVADPNEFLRWHDYLVTSPESRLVRTAVVMRREADRAHRLVGCVLHHLDEDGARKRELTTEAEWYEAMATLFHLPLRALSPRERSQLWSKVRTAHDQWQAARARATEADR